MDFSPQVITTILLFVWVLVLTLLFLQFYFYYRRLTKDGKKESLSALLDSILKIQGEHKQILEKVILKCDTLENEGKLHIQKIGLLRFNPFKDTGGDQSFILALVDAQNTGVVISSLHTRTGTRWYAKQVVRSQGTEHELSSEEEKAIKGAVVLNKTP